MTCAISMHNHQYSQVATDEPPEFRYHTDGVSLRPSNYREYALPADVLHFASGSSAEKLIDLMKIQDVQRPKASRNRRSDRTSGKTEADNKPSEDRVERKRSDSTSSSND